MKPNLPNWKTYVANELLRISKEDPIMDLAHTAFHAGLTEADVAEAAKLHSTIPDPLKIELQNKFRDISRKVKQ